MAYLRKITNCRFAKVSQMGRTLTLVMCLRQDCSCLTVSRLAGLTPQPTAAYRAFRTSMLTTGRSSKRLRNSEQAGLIISLFD